jgi:pSer/pThr/pTyr-binding forkhead associated (FHA) protein
MADRPPAPAAPESEPPVGALEHTQRFQAVAPVAPPPPTETAPVAATGRYALVSQADRVRYPLARPVVMLGRALDNDVVLEDTRVSRYHAELRTRTGRFHLRDLRSTNGTFLNGRPVVEAPLRAGDIISLGGLELMFQAEPEAGSARGS